MTACSLCGGTRWRTLEVAGPTRVVRCECGLVFVTPQPARGALEEAYDDAYYRAWESQARRRATIWRGRLARVNRLAAPPGRLLDVGCGTGAFLAVARAGGWEVAGTELSAAAVRAAAAAGLSVFHGELWEAKLAADGFDVVTCWHVLEHQSDPRRMLEEVRRVVRPGGVVVITTPNLHASIFRAAYVLARRRRSRLYEPDEREVHLFHFSRTTLAALVEACGLGVVEVGFDRGAAAERAKQFVNAIAWAWFRLSGVNWGIGLELTARKRPPRP